MENRMLKANTKKKDPVRGRLHGLAVGVVGHRPETSGIIYWDG